MRGDGDISGVVALKLMRNFRYDLKAELTRCTERVDVRTSGRE